MNLVLFIDMDAFYASCEILRNKELINKPFIVGTADNEHKLKGVIESCSYSARKLGIHSGASVAGALKKVPNIMYIPADHNYYEKISKKIFEVITSFGLKMEIISVDEAAVELVNMSYNEAINLAKMMKDKIFNEVGLPSTVGIANGVIFAKMVCDSAKPNGLKVVKDNEILNFLNIKQVTSIPGVGKKTKEKLNSMGIETINQLAKVDISRLKNKLGIFGEELHNLANGIDKSTIRDKIEIQSISRERTLENETTDINNIYKMINILSNEIIDELYRQNLYYKTITVKVRYNDFTEKIKSKSFAFYTQSKKDLIINSQFSILKLLNKKKIRKVGLRISSFIKSRGQQKLIS
ncbi:MAG: DNA polymerase IV [Candidatus Marsarchaeota archaeon]|nr:DNA polymerase IV [Candidatus Marsarchaeota archaeon]